MKTNLFKVKEKKEKEKKIIIEEERTKNPFLLFFIRNKKVILISSIMLIICLILISTGVAFSLFRGTNDYDISYIEGSETINSNNDPNLNDDDIKNELLGEVARELGITLQVKTFMSPQGDVISYFSDGTTIIVQSNGKIYRVSTTTKGDYGVNANGKIDSTAKRILVTSTTTTLTDGTIITYYSDGTAKVEYKSQILFIRDSNNIKIDNGTSLNNLAPSGVAPTKEIMKVNTSTARKFTDNTGLIIINGKKFIVNKNTELSTTETNINYSSQNVFRSISEKTYKDGNVVTHFSNGTAIITEPNGNIIYIKKSGDILLKNQQIYEIIPNDYGFSRITLTLPDKKKVTYFDNGAAIITNSDGVKQYVEDSDDIIYDNTSNINGNPTSSKQISEKVTTNGEKVFNFDNGKSQVIKDNGDSYIIDTDKLTFKPNGEINNNPLNPNEGNDSNGGGTATPESTGEIYISEAENIYNEFKNVENTKFIIKNNNNRSRLLRITIQEIEDYEKYNTDKLTPKFVKFQATVGDTYIPESRLTKNIWIDGEGKTNYIIYEGTIGAKSTQQVALSLYVDYAPLDNSYQNKGFIGTIRIYVDE